MATGYMATFHTDIGRTPKLGEKFQFPTLGGMAEFTVTELEGMTAKVESKGHYGYMRQDAKDGSWRFNHCIIDKNLKVKVRIVDSLPPEPQSNIGFTKTYK